VKWEDLGALLLDLFANLFFNKDLDEVLKSIFLDGSLHNLHHLLSNEQFVRVLCEAGGLDLSLGSLCESNSEHSENVAINGLGLNKSLNERVPLFDHRACLISRDVHSVEVSEAIVSLNLIDLESKLSPGLLLRLVVAVSEGN